MTRMRLAGCVVAALLPLLSGCITTYKHYGERMELKHRDTILLSEVLAAKDSYDGENIRVAGLVSAVGNSDGPWMRMTTGEAAESVLVRFTFPADEEPIPAAAVGYRAVVEGTVSAVGSMSEVEADRAREEGASDDDIAAMDGPPPQLRVFSPAVKIARRSWATRFIYDPPY